MEKAKLLRKSSTYVGNFARMIEKFGFLNRTTDEPTPRMVALIAMVDDLHETSKLLLKMSKL
jgi:hypothetical protein